MERDTFIINTKNESLMTRNYQKKIQTSSIEGTNPYSNFDFIRCHCQLNTILHKKSLHSQLPYYTIIFLFFIKQKKLMTFRHTPGGIDFLPRTLQTHNFFFFDCSIQSHHNRFIESTFSTAYQHILFSTLIKKINQNIFTFIWKKTKDFFSLHFFADKTSFTLCQ